MIKVSVIIPCYNVGEFVSKSIESVLGQTFKDYELIIVNDGSVDDTLDIVNCYQLRDTGIKIITKENEGLSSARNEGLNAAKGDYVFFLDGDDWILLESIEKLYTKAKEEDLDLLIADTLFYYSEERVEHVYKRPEFFNTLGIKDGISYFIELKKNNCYTPMVINQIYKRSFLINNDLFFRVGLLNEDELWTPQVICRASRVNCMDFPFYFYRQRENSIMNSPVTEKKIKDNLFIAGEIIKLSSHYSNKELAGWFWVKSYELYYRAVTQYLRNISVNIAIDKGYYRLTSLVIANIPARQFDICLKFLIESYPENQMLWLVVFSKKIFRKINRIFQ
jgi:glycosyltransferase involved in cell wall biosynthesis